MKTPTIHINGTSRQDLVEQYVNARSALHEAIRAMQATAPNGRDYYPQGLQAIHEASSEHQERLYKLEVMAGEMFDLALACNEDAT